eukprot:RCo046460
MSEGSTICPVCREDRTEPQCDPCLCSFHRVEAAANSDPGGQKRNHAKPSSGPSPAWVIDEESSSECPVLGTVVCSIKGHWLCCGLTEQFECFLPAGYVRSEE